MKIGGIDINQKIMIVAEIGNNHEGDVGRAEEMICRAADAAADAVKIQTIIPERLVAPDQTSRLAQLKRFEVDVSAHKRLAAVAKRAGVLFLSTPFALSAVELLDPLVPAFKIASGDNDFMPLLERVAATGKPIILSTGLATLEEVAAARDAIEVVWQQRCIDPGLVFLHCVSAYPTPAADANLRAIRELARLGRPVGYSDHVLGLEAAVASVALGARVIEKHFTLSKTQSEFRDHALSADPREFRELVERVRVLEYMLGDGVKRVMPSENTNLAVARRSICAARALPKGHVVEFVDLDWLRPAGGLPPSQSNWVVGKRLTRSVKAGEWLIPEIVVRAQ